MEEQLSGSDSFIVNNFVSQTVSFIYEKKRYCREYDDTSDWRMYNNGYVCRKKQGYNSLFYRRIDTNCKWYNNVILFFVFFHLIFIGLYCLFT